MIKPLFLIMAVLMSSLEPTSARPLQVAASTPADSKMLYERDCAICHGASGDGKTDVAKERQFVLLDWTDPKSLSGLSDQYIIHIIRNGRGKMPAESADRANNDQVQAIIKYIRAMAKDQAAAPPADSTPPPPHQ